MAIPRIKYFIQCDEVRNDNGKYSALGIFDTIFSFIFPATHRRFVLLLGLVGAEGKFDLELHFTSPHGTNLATIKGELTLPSPEQIGNVVFALENFPLPEEGQYTISVFLDGDFLAEYFFRVQPPFRKRERTPEEIEVLLSQPDIIQVANVDVTCEQCKTVYRFQHHLDPNTPPEPGFLNLPPGDVFACAVCGRHIEVQQIRDNLENIVGIPRQWLGQANQPQQPPQTPPATPEKPQ